MFPGTLLSLKRHYVGPFPAIAFVTFLPFHLSFSRHCVQYFSPTLCLSFSHHCILIFPPFRLSFFRHCVRLFPAILFVIFPPLRFLFSRHSVRQSSLSRCSRHYSSPSRLYVDHFVTWSPLRLSFSCRFVLHLSPEDLS